MTDYSFGPLLRERRTRAGLSQAALARAVGVNSGYISRLEAGERAAPSQELVLAIGGALNLPPEQADHLLAAAGFLPATLARLPSDDPTLTIVLRVLTDEAIPAAEREEFRQIVRLVARRWIAEG
jgi:transcriptional regulator with XRE-family HTH domain